ncbi:MAG TPA: hypothetical protein VFA41_07875 [Ktedonobacteraceae bacterium]|nr:hypothetical protein [Ktedonobacteraceae bacterium]
MLRDYTPGPNYRTYRIEVRGDVVKLLINGTMGSQSRTTKDALSNGPPGLTAIAIQLRIKSFVITVL